MADQQQQQPDQNQNQNLNNTFGSMVYAQSEGADTNDMTTRSRAGTQASMSNTRRMKRGMSRIDVAATYAREPARLRSLTIAQARARGEKDGEGSASDSRAILEEAGVSWYQTIHKLHYVCAVFSLLGFILGLVSFLTNYWYKSRLGTEERNSGLFFECINGNCVTTDWRTIFWTIHCSVSEDRLKWTYYVNRGFIFSSIVACLVTFVLIMLSKFFYLDSMRAQSFAVMTFMIIPVICWAVAIGRYANWQNKEFYCGGSFCDVKFEDTGISDCDESFGYSFILGVLCFILHIFGAIFAIARHVFGEWLLQEVEGEDLANTTRRVNVEHTVRRMRAATIAAAKQEEEQKKEQDEVLSATSRRTRGKSTIIPLVPGGGGSGAATTTDSRSVSYMQQNNNNNDPFNYAQKPPTAAEQFQAQIANQGLTPSQEDQQNEYVANDWTFDEASGLEWSAELYMYRDVDTQHLFSPESNLWYDPDKREWYQGE